MYLVLPRTINTLGEGKPMQNKPFSFYKDVLCFLIIETERTGLGSNYGEGSSHGRSALGQHAASGRYPATAIDAGSRKKNRKWS